MNNSIFDSLEVVQILDDDPKADIKKNDMYRNSHKFDYFEDPDQIAFLKGSCSTKPSAKLSESLSHKSKSQINNNFTSSVESIKNSKNLEKIQTPTNLNNIRKLNDNDRFSCQKCSNEVNESCQICRGKIHLTGNDKLIKFFEFVLEFKMGKKQSYRPQEQKLLNKRSSPNQHCNIYYSTINPKLRISQKPQKVVRFSIDNDRSEFASIIQNKDQINQNKNIHFGYNCNLCQTDPIQGLRHHCDFCEDFDLCDCCYHQFGHIHQLRTIQPKKNHKTYEKINNLFRSTNINGLRSSIKNQTSSRSSQPSKAFKSWIR